MSYNERVSVSWFDVSSSYSSFGVFVSCCPAGDQTDVIVIGYKISGALLKKTLDAMIKAHPIVGELKNLKSVSDLSALYINLDSRLDLKKTGIAIEWQPMRSTLLSVAVNFYANITQTFVKDIVSNKFSVDAIPECWLNCPPELSFEEWRMSAYYLLATYEAGCSTRQINLPKPGRDLPLQYFARSVVHWRKIPEGIEQGMSDLKSQHFSLSNGEELQIHRIVQFGESATDRLVANVESSLTMDKTLNFKNQWIVLSYWASATVICKHKSQDWMCTIGGSCKCLFYIDTDTCVVRVYQCEKHSFEITKREKASLRWSEYMSRGPKACEDVVNRMNLVLSRWNKETGRTTEPGAKTLPLPEHLTKGFVDEIGSMLVSDELQHSRNVFTEAYDQFMKLLTRKPGSLGTIMASALQQLSDAALPMDEDDDDDEIYCDTIESSHGHLIGWQYPVTNQRPRWSWIKTIDRARLHKTDIRIRDVERQSARANTLGARMSFSEWERIKSMDRVQLPKRATEKFGSYVSRAGMKMQQLWEADPDFWEDSRVYLDPTSGYGGFVEFLAGKLAKSKPRQYVMSTLVEKDHRMIHPRITTLESNLRPIIATPYDAPDKGNIKDPRCIDRLKNITQSCGGLDLLVLDAGEFSSSLITNRLFWLQPLNGVSFLDAACRLIDLINPGGKMCFKMNGVWDGCFDVLHMMTKHFREIKAIKLATTHHGSPEFYVFCRGYNPDRRADAIRTQHLLNLVIDATYDSYLVFNKILINRGRGYRPVVRYDWYSPIEKTGVVRILDSANHYPPPVEIDCDGIKYCWMPNWENRIGNFKAMVRLKGKKLLRDSKIGFVNVCPIGAVARKRTSHPHKNVENGLISGFMSKVFSLNATNSTFCHTQTTDKWKEASQKKRLDVDPGHMDQSSFKRLIEAFFLTDSEYGKSLYGRCRLLTEEEVLISVNNQGATGILDDGHTMREYIEKHPNWYQDSLKQIDLWLKGRDGGTYFTCRPKNEPKKKKNVDNGKLNHKKGTPMEELESFNEQGHRFIQFADAKTRLSHYVLLGDLISKANKTKVYKGTINGTPVMRQGNVLRAMWDRYLPMEQKEITSQIANNFGVWIDDIHPRHTDEPVHGACLDYSGWDTSVTIEERLLEAVWLSNFYPENLKRAILNACMEMAYPIVTNDDGEVWLRGGQRGSGELLTSLGNTKLVACNTLIAVSESMGVPLIDLCKTTAKISYRVGEVRKVIEVMEVTQVSDGDDTVIIGSEKMIKRIADGIEARQRKSIRSGDKVGVKVVFKFEDLEFCSHNYHKVIIGDSLGPVKKDGLVDRLSQSPYCEVWYLPSRPIADIFSKMRLTLKTSSQTWNPNNEECVLVTRSKIMSYLLLYPHIRPVRHACLTMLAVTGEGELDLVSLTKRYDWSNVLNQETCRGALRSIYGVADLGLINYRQYSLDHRDMRNLQYNVSLTHLNYKISQYDYIPKMMHWLHGHPTVEVGFIEWDPRMRDMIDTGLTRRKGEELVNPGKRPKKM